MRENLNIGIVGATGLIGRAFIKTIEQSSLPVKSIRLFASPKSIGTKIDASGHKITVEGLDENCFNGLDLVFFSAGKEVSKIYAPIAERSGATVIDNSSAFRQDNAVPLVIPEINGENLLTYKGRLIANPNCSTAIALLPLNKINALYGVKRLVFTTYQAVSGSGNKGLIDLERGFCGKSPKFYPVDVSKNCIPQIGNLKEFGYTDEELKMVNETQKILQKRIKISATCVRVPIKNCHAISVEVELEKPFLDEEIKSVFTSTGGVLLCDLPTQELADGKREVYVGRIKRSLAFKNGLSFFCVGDNTLKGAALNAVQIAEFLFMHGRI